MVPQSWHGSFARNSTNRHLMNWTINPVAETGLPRLWKQNFLLQNRQKTNEEELSLKTCSLPGITKLFEFTKNHFNIYRSCKVTSCITRLYTNTHMDIYGDFLDVLGITCFIGLLHINCLRDGISTPFSYFKCGKKGRTKRDKMTDVMVNLTQWIVGV